jgi:hypothetical protein
MPWNRLLGGRMDGDHTILYKNWVFSDYKVKKNVYSRTMLCYICLFRSFAKTIPLPFRFNKDFY